MLNPQRTLERGYAVILKEENEILEAVRNPKELSIHASYQVRLAEGQIGIEISKVGN
jgi:exodeoxyribonuclease VII large subunit